MFYVMLALRAELRNAAAFRTRETNLGALTDLVALGTVADVVPLDANNRNLVAQGLKRLRAGRGAAGHRGAAARRRPQPGRGVELRPRLHRRPAPQRRRAARRHEPRHRVPDHRRRGARRQLRAAARPPQPRAAARSRPACSSRRSPLLKALSGKEQSTLLRRRPGTRAWSASSPRASRTALHRPVICFARGSRTGAPAEGSGRSIAGLHLRDCLDLVSKRAPGLILRFGGHAHGGRPHDRRARLSRASPSAFERALDEMLPPAARQRARRDRRQRCDAAHRTLARGAAARGADLGPGLSAAPLLRYIRRRKPARGRREAPQAAAGEGRPAGSRRCASARSIRCPPQVRAAYRLGVNEFNGLKTVQLNVEHFE